MEREECINKAAFELGKMEWKSSKWIAFDDVAVWKPNLEPFKYPEFFNWNIENIPIFPIENVNDYKSKTNEIILTGRLNFTLFKTLDSKLNFIKGLIKNPDRYYLQDNILIFQFVNSLGLRDIIASWLIEISFQYGFYAKDFEIKTKTNYSTIPIVSSISIEGKELIDLIFKN